MSSGLLCPLYNCLGALDYSCSSGDLRGQQRAEEDTPRGHTKRTKEEKGFVTALQGQEDSPDETTVQFSRKVATARPHSEKRPK